MVAGHGLRTDDLRVMRQARCFPAGASMSSGSRARAGGEGTRFLAVPDVPAWSFAVCEHLVSTLSSEPIESGALKRLASCSTAKRATSADLDLTAPYQPDRGPMVSPSLAPPISSPLG